jgi:hypothetical protein
VLPVACSEALGLSVALALLQAEREASEAEALLLAHADALPPALAEVQPVALALAVAG